MMSIFVLNCGSSSIKFQVIQPENGTVLLKGMAENIGTDRCVLEYGKEKKKLPQADYQSVALEITEILKAHPEIEEGIKAVGHRVVHGGESFQESTIIDEDVLTQIKEYGHLAPLHNPANALGIEIMQQFFPTLPQIAVFDTAFHQTMPEHAFLYGIPFQFYEKYAIRRYGFHGTSHRYIVSLAAEKLGMNVEDTAIISAHLGNGCSVCATLGGKSLDTSMGFTPLEGLLMGHRSGDIDPSIVGFLSEHLQVDAQDVVNMLNKQGGLLGVSEKSEDMRLVKQAADEGDELAIAAIEMFCYRLAKYIASYIVPIGLPNALVFTGGIGENAPYIRQRVIEWLEPMGFSIDSKRNVDHGAQSKGVISADSAVPTLLVLPTNEELLIARDAMKLIQGESL